MRIEGHGITVELPTGWEGEITRRPPDAGEVDAVGAASTDVPDGVEIEMPVTHLANFALPADRGDFGSGAVEIMTTEDVLVCLLEDTADNVGSPLFSTEGVPTLDPEQFAPQAMQRTIEGMSGAQAFFTEAGRAFCLYAVIGSHARRRTLVPVINDLLAGVRITAA